MRLSKLRLVGLAVAALVLVGEPLSSQRLDEVVLLSLSSVDGKAVNALIASRLK